MAIAREAGQRSKIAVRSNRSGVSPKGSLIGPMGARSSAVMDELFGEKIDIVDFDEDPAKFVAHALSPAKVASVTIVDETTRSAKVVVPDYQLSLAIGKDGRMHDLPHDLPAGELISTQIRHPHRGAFLREIGISQQIR